MNEKWPASKIVMMDIDELTPYVNNSRVHSEAQVDQIVASIREWGWTVPVLIAEDGMLIAGHGRLLAAQKLGIEQVPSMVARGWTDAQKRAYVIADNKIASNAGWDDEMLAIELAGIGDFDMQALGFSDEEKSFIGTMSDVDGVSNNLLDELINPSSKSDREMIESERCPTCGGVIHAGR